MGLVERPSLVEKARRAFGIIQSGFGSTVSDELVPVVLVDDVTGPDTVSQGYPRYAFGNPQKAAVALENGMCILRNPTGSGVRIFVDTVAITLAAAGLCSVRRALPGVVTFAASARKQWADWRVPVASQPAAQMGTDSAIGLLGTAFMSFRLPDTGTFTVPLGITIEPGNDDLVIGDAVVNQAIEAVFWFRESTIEGGG